LAIICAIVPSLLLLWYFYKRDLNPEPRGVLIKTFLLGILIVLPVMIFAFPLWFFNPQLNHPMLAGLYVALLCAAVPEEFFKFLVVTRYSARNPAFDEPMDGVVYGATASLGFATLENILYVAQGGWIVAVARALTAVPCHACLGAILGYYVGQARFKGERKVSAWLGLLVATLLHALYDFPLLAMRELDDDVGRQLGSVLGLLVFFLAVFVFEIVWTLRIIRRLRREQIQVTAWPATTNCSSRPINRDR
jgi:RsiW-degrading membrane proteinase PrsW (M82 family)